VTLRQEGRTPAQARNVAIVAAWVDAYNHMDFDALASIAAPDLEVDDPATGTHLQGWAAFRARAEEIVTRYPDRRITVTGVMALGDSAVAVDAYWQATENGRSVRHAEAMLVEVVGDRIVRRRIYR